ncbi:MAG TPA: hypothetical protein EYN67_04010 [Flavobacteriales bacterium]|jgi:hypothetical protein|nr:hypothetical protein [Flavobacteriales bacterium]
MNRKQRRTQVREMRRTGEDDLADKTSLMGTMPEECSACLSPFDKKDREQLSSWSVVVREEEKIVRLYCPTCWEKAKQYIKSVEEAQETNVD